MTVAAAPSAYSATSAQLTRAPPTQKGFQRWHLIRIGRRGSVASIGMSFESVDDGLKYKWRGDFENDEVNRLHVVGFEHLPLEIDWRAQLDRYSLGWVCARRGGRLVGFVNVAWDGDAHAFLLDTVVARSARRVGIGTGLVSVATEHVRAAGCEWLHVDFEEHLRGFYLETCRFTETPAGLIRLQASG